MCKKKRCVAKICTSLLQAWDNNTLHPVMISECWGMLSALQTEKESSKGSSSARKSLAVSTSVYGWLSLFGMYKLWKETGRIFILFSCRDLIHKLQISFSFHISVKQNRFCKELSLGNLLLSLAE